MNGFLAQLFLVITFGGIAQGLFVVFILNSRSVRKSRANIFLSILLIWLSFSIAHTLFAGLVLDHFSARVYSFGDPTFYLIAPLLWFYTQELTGQRVRWSWTLVLHFLPFLLIIIFSTTLRNVSSGSTLMFLDRHHRLIRVLFWISVVVQFSWYLMLVRKRFIAYQQFIKDEVSNREGIDIGWVRFFMVVFLIINLFFLFSLIVVIHVESSKWLVKTTAVIFSLSVFALGYKGILQKEVFQKEGETSADSIRELPVVNKPDPTLVASLLLYMSEKKSYLNPELTLSNLATEMKMSRSQLSVLINDGTGDNFYDFINKYRVEEVKRLMADPKVKNYSLLGIALEAGFKSKSTFNLIFKRFTGLTPSEYRKNLIP